VREKGSKNQKKKKKEPGKKNEEREIMPGGRSRQNGSKGPSDPNVGGVRIRKIVSKKESQAQKEER